MITPSPGEATSSAPPPQAESVSPATLNNNNLRVEIEPVICMHSRPEAG
jgi:hypothetical protein